MTNITAPRGLVNSRKDLTQAYIFDTVADYQASTIEFPVGKIIHLKDRGADFEVVAYNAGANGFDEIKNTAGNHSIELTRKESQFVDAFGAVENQDSSSALQAAATSGVMNFYPKRVYLGSFTFGNDLVINGNKAQLNPTSSGKLIKNIVGGVSLEINKLDSELGLTYISSTDGFIETDNLTSFVLDDCKIREGGRHVWSKNTTKLRWTNNKSLDSNDWGLYFEGSLDYIIDNNIANGCKTHDGIKGGGIVGTTIVNHRRGYITNNTCKGNFRDGIDCALNGATVILIAGNECEDNSLKGIDLKILNSPTGPQTNFTQLLVSDNIISGSDGISLQNNDTANVDFKDSVVQGNLLNSVSGEQDAIRIQSCENVEVKNNNINGYFYGVRVVDAALNNKIHHNDINAAIAFRLEDQGLGTPTGNRFWGNDINQFTLHANSNTAQVVDGDGSVFYDNTIYKDPNSQYSLSAENLGTNATNTEWYNNTLAYVSSAPLGFRTVVGDIFIDNNPTLGSPERWVSHTQTSSSTLNTLSGFNQRGFRSSAGDPNGVVTTIFFGEDIYDSVGGRFWKSWNSGNGNWK